MPTVYIFVVMTLASSAKGLTDSPRQQVSTDEYPEQLPPITISEEARPSGAYVVSICSRLINCDYYYQPSPAQNATRCGDRHCWCLESEAICSASNGKLQYIPRLPSTITFLDFSGNKLTAINDSTFFKNVTQLNSLDLSCNDLSYLTREAFSLLTNLTVLWLRNNLYLDIAKNLAAFAHMTSLQKLDLGGTIVSSFKLFPQLRSLTEICLHHTRLRFWNATVFQPLQRLQYLELSDNDMRYISTTHLQQPLHGLVILRLAYNDMFYFPKSCVSTKYPSLAGTRTQTSIYPNLERLVLTGNRIRKLSTKVCLPKLRALYLNYNPLSTLVTNMFSNSHFPSLLFLELSRLSRPVSRIEAYAFNNTSLVYLTLMYNNINMVSNTVCKDSFRGLTGLRQLQLEHNYLSNGRFMRLFSESTALQRLYMGNANLDKLTQKTFSSFPNLQRITLHRNDFTSLPEGVFDGLKNLTEVDLSNCRIAIISQETFREDTRKRLRKLDLSGNHFDCSCDLLWFRDWLTSADTIFNGSYAEYKCYNLPDIHLAHFRMNQQVCLFSLAASVFTIVVVALLMGIFTLVATVFRYRWHIRLMLYEAFRGKGHNCMRAASHFRYDVFVSYANQDLTWVRRCLLPRLEDGLGARLCIHQRDFLPGENIVDNIFHSVRDSRKIMMLFSRNFAQSEWCQFELALSLRHVMDHNDALLITCIDDVTSSGCLTPTMMAVLNTTTYIQWAEDSDAKASFWGRLRIALF